MKKSEITLLHRLQYAFDRTLSRSPLALGGWLALLSLLFVVFMTLLIYLIHSNGSLGLPQLFYTILFQALTPNPVDPTSGAWPFLFAMLVITLGGLLIFSIFIGIFSATIDNRLQSLRQGRSLVLEKNHTVILGWSSQIFPIISELTIANENHPGRCIAILADKDKIEMEDEIKTKVSNLRNTRVVCRNGDPMDLNDLEIVSPETSRSIIVLATHPLYHDAEVLKTILAVINHPKRRPEPYQIVGSLRDPASQEVAKLFSGSEVLLFQVDELISHITAQTCRQSGLSIVYEELLDFGGDEIYFKHEPDLTGKTFSEALFCYSDSSLIGIASSSGGIQLKPPMDTRINADDRIIIIAADDDSIHLSPSADFKIDAAVIHSMASAPREPERTLILGWNRRAPLIINYLDAFVTPGSDLRVVADVNNLENEIRTKAGKTTNQKLTYQQADTTSRQVLDTLEYQDIDHVIILSYSPELDIQRADSRTMMTLLHLRDIANKRGHPLPIVSEIMDIRNRDLIEVARVDDFIISDRLVSLALTQLSENERLLELFKQLFDPLGAEIYLKPVEEYIYLGQPLNFYTVLEAARQRDEVAIGYRRQSEARDIHKDFGVHLNPKKSETIKFSIGDRIIVIAEQQ
jgi:voltage-gated potassium channel Kch